MSREATSTADCQSGHLVTFEAGGWSLGPLSLGGVTLNIYAVSDPAAIKALATSIQQARSQVGDVKVDLNVFSSKHDEPRIRVAEFRIS
jgi:hypothetical protein